MTFYTDLANVATQLLTDKGQQITITRNVVSSLDPVTGIATPGTAVTITGYGAAFDYNKSEIDGTLIRNGDIRLIFQATSTAPEVDDIATVDSIDYRVMAVNKSAPAGTVLKYELQLRK